MQYYIQTDSGHDLVLEGIDQLTFAAGSIEAAYERVYTAAIGEIAGRTSRTTLQAAVLDAVSQEVLDVSHADVRELHVLLDVAGDDVDTVVAATFEKAVSTIARWRRHQSSGNQTSRTNRA